MFPTMESNPLWPAVPLSLEILNSPFSKSASSHTMRGFFPPDSIETLVRFSADAFIIALAIELQDDTQMTLVPTIKGRIIVTEEPFPTQK